MMVNRQKIVGIRSGVSSFVEIRNYFLAMDKDDEVFGLLATRHEADC